MEWNTPVSIDLQQGAVTHHHRMMLFGSCFAEHIGTRLGEFHFRVDVNPFGIQYNPLSIWRSSGVMDHGSLLQKVQSYID